ncbi:MAG: hypothetical protein AAF716_20290 [Cyanobacteria bacterium P01_D01_bin.1]
MPRFTSPAETMTSNSRLTSSNTALGLAPQSRQATNTQATDSYSNSLMDDLFGDVDRILEGDLSDCMTFAERKPRAVAPSTSRTVQLPSHFSPRSAADIYRATMAADRSTQAAQQAGNQTGHGTGHQISSQPGYRAGGRPVTTQSFEASSTGNLFAGNLQSSVIQAPIYSSSHSSGHENTATIEVKAPPIQSVSNSLYPDIASTFSFKDASPRPQQTIFEPRRQKVSLPFMMMGAAGISVVSTLGLWTVSAASSAGWTSPLNTEAAAAELPADSDADFLAYLQRALETISTSQITGGQTVAVLPVAAPAVLPTTIPNVNPPTAVGALPTLPAPTLPAPTLSASNPSGAIAETPSVIERVFVPVYQNGQNTSQNAATANAAPSTTAALPPIALASANNARRRPTVPVPVPVAAAAALPSGAPATGISSIPIVPVGNRSLPSPGVDLAVGSSVNPTAGLNDVTPASELVLVGVLNLGNRSAALFDIDGSSQRAYVGDRIGLSNWSLVSVNGQDVVIRRNDEVRSVYIGQRF